MKLTTFDKYVDSYRFAGLLQELWKTQAVFDGSGLYSWSAFTDDVKK